MSSVIHTLGQHNSNLLPDGKGYRVGIVVSEYYPDITTALLEGCYNTLTGNGVLKENIFVQHAPGSYELPLCAAWIYKHQTPDAVICLGCVVKGETRHFDFICSSVSDAIMNLGLQHNVPFIFGVLTPDSMQQALDRAGGKHGNKGVEAAIAALKMIALRRSL